MNHSKRAARELDLELWVTVIRQIYTRSPQTTDAANTHQHKTTLNRQRTTTLNAL
jgi:hypothetical protein